MLATLGKPNYNRLDSNMLSELTDYFMQSDAKDMNIYLTKADDMLYLVSKDSVSLLSDLYGNLTKVMSNIDFVKLRLKLSFLLASKGLDNLEDGDLDANTETKVLNGVKTMIKEAVERQLKVV